MRGDETFIGVFREVFQLATVRELSCTKEDIENMPPYERVAYFDLVNEQRQQKSAANNSNSNEYNLDL
jgi:hypothetical protein